MEKFAIYSFKFIDVPIEPDWTKPEGAVAAVPKTDDERRMWLNRLFGQARDEFVFKKQNKNDADRLPCTVMSHPDRFVLLRLENPKTEHIYDKRQSQAGEVPRIDMREVPSFPYLYIVFDFREGVGCKIAISVASDAWRKLDIVAKLIEENVNHHLKNQESGFGISISPETLPIDFVSHSRRLIKKQKLSVKKMTFYFTRGLINPKVEEIVKSDKLVRSWINNMIKAQHGEVTLYDPDSSLIARKNTQILEHLAMLVGSDPMGSLFRLKMSYSDGSTYSCGKDIRMEFDMDDVTMAGLLGYGTLFPENTIANWFDRKTLEIEEQRHAETSNQIRTTEAGEILQPA